MNAALSPARELTAGYARDRIALSALWVLCALLLAALAAPWITPQDPYDLAQLDILDARLAPGEASSAGYTYWLGSDGQGRDMLSAILHGLRISLGVGVLSTLAALALGLAVGQAPA
ncbi:MAG: ABC transporter permease, partial [Burkholderiales bacterium]